MQSPLHRTPGTGRRRSVARTPLSALTPNDDAAEKASIRRQRQVRALRKSLSYAFADNDQQQQQQPSAGPTLSSEALNAMFEHCIKLAAENKITDRNVWQLDLISHLPDIVLAGQGLRSAAGGFNFQKVSGGLDAGVTIYSKRVDQTYKEAFLTLQGTGAAASKGNDAGDDGDDGVDGTDDDADGDGLEDAAGAAARQAKQQAGGAKRRQQVEGREEATLARPDQLAAKKADNTFAVDPLFHKVSALFDEGGAKGLLLLNRSVFRGVAIMTNPHDIPEQQFPLTLPPAAAAAAAADTLVNLAPLQTELAACQQGSTAAAGAEAAAAVLTPGLEQLYALLEVSAVRQKLNRQQQQAQQEVDVAAVMAAATTGLPDTPMPGTCCSLQQPAAAAAGGAAAAAAAAAAGGSERASMVTAFLATQPLPEDEEAAAAAAAAGGSDRYDAVFDGVGDEMGDNDNGNMAGDEEHAGYGEDDGAEWEIGGLGGPGQQQQQQQGRRQSGVQELLGLGGGGGWSAEAADGRETLDAEALQQLLGAAGAGGGSGGAGVVTKGAGWAGSSFWRYRSAAAAVARLAGGGTGSQVKRAASAAAAAGTRSRPGQSRIDFDNVPELPPDALAAGSRRQTCLVTAATTANTLLPRDLHYEAASLGRLFLKPARISIIRHPGSRVAAAGESSSSANAWTAAADDSEGGGGYDGYDGYEDDGDDSSVAAGAEGYNAGDLSMGDPGSAAGVAGAGGEGGRQRGGDWWSPDHELLRAPARAAGLGGVNYNRSAKQVDVRALKDLLWDSLITHTHNQQAPAAADAAAHDDSADDDAAAAAAAGDQPSDQIPFQQLIVGVPEQSAAGAREDVSVHMCFICLLHLANEKGLVIRAQDDLATLHISNVPQS